jgi:hypothetical protein
MCQRIHLTSLVLVGLAVWNVPREASAALAHRYSFTSDANDSVGTAHGTVVDAGTPSHVFANGQLDLTANTGQGSNAAMLTDAYVDLPNGIISTAAANGPSGAFSFELWATVATTRTWQRFVDVGSANGGENASDGGGMTDYLYIAANSGRFGNGVATEVHAANQAGAATEIGQMGAPPLNVQQHIVGTYDQNDTSSGPNGTMRLYRNGASIGAAAIPPNIILNTFTNDNNWLGRSQWPDPIFDGSFNEFRVYDHALTASEVTTNTFFGPDVVGTGELPSLTVNKNTGQITMTNSTSVNLNIEFYRISSAGSAVSVAGWNSLDDQNYDAVDGGDPGAVAGDSDGEGWDEAGGSNASQLVELFLGESGSTFGPSETLNLGNAFNTSVFGPGNNGDLQFTLGLLGGGQFNLNVNYVSGPVGVMGDYNNNGTVDAADYVLWRNNGPLQNEGVTPGTVTPEDYTFWRSRFGATSGVGAGPAAVPEPAVAFTVTILLASAALCVRRRG